MHAKIWRALLLYNAPVLSCFLLQLGRALGARIDFDLPFSFSFSFLLLPSSREGIWCGRLMGPTFGVGCVQHETADRRTPHAVATRHTLPFPVVFRRPQRWRPQSTAPVLFPLTALKYWVSNMFLMLFLLLPICPHSIALSALWRDYASII